MGDYFCPNCGADLENQYGFDPNESYWTCTSCGALLTNPYDSDMDTLSGIIWFCDCCGACLNKQYGFDEKYGSWTCTECGHVNSLGEDNVYSSEDEYQSNITHYTCPNCGAELNKQPSFYEDDEYTCESCGEELYKDGSEYEKKYTCPHCGAILNSQWGFNSWSDSYNCSDCGSWLQKYGDEYEEVCQNEDDSDDEYKECDEELEAEELEAEGYSEPFHSGTSSTRKSFGRRHWKGVLISITLTFCVVAAALEIYEYKKSIPVGVNSVELLGAQYEDAVSELQENGFKNIRTNEVEDLKYTNIREEGTVKSITVRPVSFLLFLQESNFTKSDRLPYDSLITIDYHSLKKISVPISSKEAKKKKYKDIQKQFKKAGFANIKIKKHDDLVTGWIHKDGSVEKVSINGETKFGSQDLFRPDAEVVITYHAFKK